MSLGRARRERKTLQIMLSAVYQDRLGAQRRRMVADPATLEDTKPEWNTEKYEPTFSYGIFMVSLFTLWFVCFFLMHWEFILE